MRIIFRSQRRDIFTGLFCFKENLDRKSFKVGKAEDKANAINQNLDLSIRKATHAFDELKFSGESFTIDELVDKIKGKEETPCFIDRFPGGRQSENDEKGRDGNP